MSDSASSTDVAKHIDVDPNRLAGRIYEVELDYLVTYSLTLVAGPDEHHAVESAREVATPASGVDASDWDLIHNDVEAIEPVWMDDPKAPKAATWLEEPHVPSEETFWDDSRHFDSEEGHDVE